MRFHVQQRGFSMIELLIALAVGAFGMAVAANVQTWGWRQSNRGREGVELASRQRLAVRQVRADVEITGLGSTGAIGVAGGGAVRTAVTAFQTPPNNKWAIPAVRGLNNTNSAQAVGGQAVLEGSDILQLVVADPSTSSLTGANGCSANSLTDGIGSQDDRLWVATPLAGAVAGVRSLVCPGRLVYIRDGAGPAGIGRSFLLVLPANSPTCPTAANITPGVERLPTGASDSYVIPPGAEVMCARISTYWMDQRKRLHRSDWGTAANVASAATAGSHVTVSGASGSIRVSPANVGVATMVSPGVEDFQVAYGLSAEVTNPRVSLSDPARWGYGDVGAVAGTGDPTGNLLANWFEVRQVRFNLLMRSLRAVGEGKGSFKMKERLEDRAVGSEVEIEIGYTRQNIVTIAFLQNMRYFDQNTLTGLRAEPY